MIFIGNFFIERELGKGSCTNYGLQCTLDGSTTTTDSTTGTTDGSTASSFGASLLMLLAFILLCF